MTDRACNPPDRADSPPVRTVALEASALETIRAEILSSSPHLETGGILLGYPTTHAADLRIKVAGGPGPNAVHEPRRFSRDPVYAQSLADQAWAAHGAVWIGEWHTHPKAGLSPSDIDLRSYMTHLGDPELGFEEFLSLIVAGTAAVPRLAAWIITPTYLIAAQLKLAAGHDDEDDLDSAEPAVEAHAAGTGNQRDDQATGRHDRETP